MGQRNDKDDDNTTGGEQNTYSAPYTDSYYNTYRQDTTSKDLSSQPPLLSPVSTTTSSYSNYTDDNPPPPYNSLHSTNPRTNAFVFENPTNIDTTLSSHPTNTISSLSSKTPFYSDYNPTKSNRMAIPTTSDNDTTKSMTFNRITPSVSSINTTPSVSSINTTPSVSSLKTTSTTPSVSSINTTPSVSSINTTDASGNNTVKLDTFNRTAPSVSSTKTTPVSSDRTATTSTPITLKIDTQTSNETQSSNTRGEQKTSLPYKSPLLQLITQQANLQPLPLSQLKLAQPTDDTPSQEDSKESLRRIVVISGEKGEVKQSSTREVKENGNSQQVVEIKYPHELKKCTFGEIKQLCNDHKISIVAKEKWDLIGRALTIFPSNSVTEETLDKFSEEQLTKMCRGAWLSPNGKKEDLVLRLIHYNKQLLPKVQPKTKKYKTKKAGTTKSSKSLPKTKPSKKRKHTNQSSEEEKEKSKSKSKSQKITDNLKPSKKRKLLHSQQPDTNTDTDTDTKQQDTTLFLQMAPPIPVVLQNNHYELNPQQFDDNNVGWENSGKQKVKVGGKNYKVKWNVNMTLLPDDEEDNEVSDE